jgi:uncharacterized Fe-S cluster-containing MiaB family protein
MPELCVRKDENWEIVEILIENADFNQTKKITMFDIGKELKDAGRNNSTNVQEIKKLLVDFGYIVVVGKN